MVNKKSKQKQGSLKVDASKELEAYAEIKKAETLEREKLLKNAKVTIITAESESDLVGFDIWWMDISRRVELKQWMKEIVKADFKGRGLNKEETVETFDDGLRAFGVKF